jgi:hypothetical protein
MKILSKLYSRMAMIGGPADISSLLAAWGKGDEAALNDLMPIVYGDLAKSHAGN